jgi:holo-[acyl-carrier protein] synthase
MIGIDIVKTSRIEKAINRWGDSFIDKIFTKNEKQYCENKINKYQCYAARYAVKESFYKAKNHNHGWKAIEVRTEGKPVIRILNKKLKDEMEGIKTHVSLSHTNDTAIAAVLLVDSSNLS